MDNFISNNFLDLLHYKIGYKIYAFLKFNNHPNIIIYGHKNSGKSLLIEQIMKNIYPGKCIKYQSDFFNLLLYSNYYVFNCSYINKKKEFIEYIQNIVLTYDYYRGKSKYIILDQFEKVNEHIQNALKVIMEKAYHTCKFIIITNTYTKVIPPICSRCICFRIPLPSHYDKFIFCKNLFIKNNKPYNDFLLLKDCKGKELNWIIYKYLIYEPIDLYNSVYDRFYLIIHKKKLEKRNIQEIRKITSEIKELDISSTQIMNQFILSLSVDHPYYSKLILTCSEYNYRIVNSYRELIHLESLFIYLNLIINGIYNHGLLSNS